MSITLTEVLRRQLQAGSQELYAQALCFSRTQQANQDIINMLQILVAKQGHKWLEVISRLARGTAKQSILKFCIANWELYGAIIEHLDRTNLTEAVLEWMVEHLMKQLHNKTQYTAILETVGRLTERVLQLEIDYRPLLPFLSASLSSLLFHNTLLKDEKYTRCLIHLAKLNSVAQVATTISNQQDLKQLYEHILNQLLCNNALESAVQFQLLIELSSIYLCYDWFNQHIRDIIPKIESTLTNYTHSIKSLIQSEPEEVLNYEYDISYCKNSETMPVLAAQFFLTLCRKIDGMLPSVLSRLLETVNQQNTLLFLAILQPEIRQRNRLADQLEQYFQQNHKQLFELRQHEPLYNIRLLCLIEKYSIHLMYDDLKSALKCIILAMQMPHIVSCRACTVMECFLEQYDPRFLEPQIYNLSSEVYRLMDLCQHVEFFEMLRVFLKQFDILAEMYCMKIIGKLVDKVADSPVGIKILDCIVEIAKKEGIVRDMCDEIDRELVRLQLTRINCDRMYLIGSLLVSHTDRLSQFSTRLLEAIGQLYQRQQTLNDCQQFIIACCTYCPEAIRSYNIHHLLIRQLHRLEKSEDEQYKKTCYIYQLHLQSVKQVDIFYTSQLSTPWTDGIIISLSPYAQVRLVQPGAVKCQYHRQMWLYYYYHMLPRDVEGMQQYVYEYMRLKSVSRDMEVEEDEDCFNIWLNTIKFPILKENWFNKIKEKVSKMPGMEQLKMALTGRTDALGNVRKIVKLKQ